MTLSYTYIHRSVGSHLGSAIQRTQGTMREFAPLLAADVVEGDNDFHVHVDLPGVAQEDLDINIANGFLHLKAERKQVHEENLWLSHSIERSYGRISRSIQLPARADADNTTASFQNGVLSVVFGKLEGPAKGKKLQIT